MKNSILCSVLFLMLTACGGGGGHGDLNSSSIDPVEVDRLALAEAIYTALDETTVFCDEVFCPFADLSDSYADGIARQHVCQFDCITVIDELGFQRQFYIALLWQRAEPACYEEDEVQLWFWGEQVYGCNPHVSR